MKKETDINVNTAGILFIIFIATLIRSSFGFGEALVAVPLLALLIPLKVATPLVVLVSITIAGIIVMQDWHKIHFRSAGWLLFSTLIGIPLGLILLTSGEGQIAKAGLAFTIIAFSIYSLSGRLPLVLISDSPFWLFFCGFCAGLLGGAYGMNGPPLVIYGTMRRWSASHFRATLQAYFLPASMIALAGYWHAGLWVPEVTHYYLLSLPAILPAIFLGRTANHHLNGKTFFKYIYTGLIAIGALLLYEVISK